jgi:GNAT superfamily N-acetyltransferase
MREITFENIYTIGEVIEENDVYKHVHYPEMLVRYDSNFLEFKKMPTLKEFKEGKAYLRKFHQGRGQKHIKFYFPPNMEISDDLAGYLKLEGIDTGFMELYSIDPSDFRRVSENEDVIVKEVSEDEFDKFIALQYEQDLAYGQDFADQKIALQERQLNDPSIVQLLSYYKGEPAGAADVIIEEETAEIDGFFVLEKWQRKGIGTSVQQYVMDRFKDKMIILVADGEDTPREMYQKQNYRCLGFQYQAQKVFQDK